MSDDAPPLLRRVWFSGRVQGVGFRATTSRIASGYEVAGYVQNLADGRVVVVLEGLPVEIDRFLDELRTTMGRYIRGEQSADEPASGQWGAFTVRA